VVSERIMSCNWWAGLDNTVYCNKWAGHDDVFTVTAEHVVMLSAASMLYNSI
jgi:hypothetical protein